MAKGLSGSRGHDDAARGGLDSHRSDARAGGPEEWRTSLDALGAASERLSLALETEQFTVLGVPATLGVVSSLISLVAIGSGVFGTLLRQTIQDHYVEYHNQQVAAAAFLATRTRYNATAVALALTDAAVGYGNASWNSTLANSTSCGFV